MLRALLYIFGGLFTAHGLLLFLYTLYRSAVNENIEPEMEALFIKNMAGAVEEASVSLFMGLVLLSIQRIITLLSE